MAILIIAKVLIFTSLLISIILALEVDEDYQMYFNDELNVPPPQMETFNNYEEMRKYLENNSNVELIDNPTFDTYLLAYNLHHIKHEKPEISQRLSMLKRRTKRRALPFPYDFIKFELSDAIIPDKATRELIRKHREREPKILESVESPGEGVIKEQPAPKRSKELKKEETMTKLKIVNTTSTNGRTTTTTTTTTPKTTTIKTTTTERINKTRRATRRIQRKKLRQNQNSTPIKRMDTNIDPTLDMDRNKRDNSDLEVHESQNVHYFAAMPSGEAISKHKISNIFPHEVQKAIDFVLAENKQGNQNIGGKTANMKYIQIPIYHKQPYYGDKMAFYQTPKIAGNKNHPNGYESYNKYLQAYALPLVTTNNHFKQILTMPQLNAAEDIEKIHQQQQQQQYYLSHQYYEQYPKQYYTIQTTANSLPVQYEENPSEEIKQTATANSASASSSSSSSSSSSDINHIPTSHQNQIINKQADSDTLMYSQVTQQTPLNAIGHSNIESDALNVQPDLSEVHTIIQPQEVTVKFPLPEINYVFHQQDIAADAAPVSLKLSPVTPAPVRAYTLAIPKPTPSSALIKNDNNDVNSDFDANDDDQIDDKSVQSLEVKKSLQPDIQYKNYELLQHQQQHQQHQYNNQHYYHHQVYAPISLQNEMLAKTVLINHGYNFDDSTNLAGGSDAHSGGNGNTENESIKNEKVTSSSVYALKSEANEKYAIKSSPLPQSHSYILSTTPSTYYSYMESNTASAPIKQYHQQQQYEEIQEHQYHQHQQQQQQQHQQQQQQEQYKEEEALSVTSQNHYSEKDIASATVSYPVNNEKDMHFETSSLNYKELSSLIGKSPTDQMNGLNYLIEKELQNNILKSKEMKRPQDNRSPILFHPDQKNGGDNFKGKKVFINEYGIKEIKNENSDSATATATIEKPNKLNENNNVVHITPAPPASSYNQYHLLSPNYKYGTRLYGLHESKNKDMNGLQYASKYAFGYRVRDFHTGNDYGHKQKRDHDGVTRGEYHILLPDGRVQNVRYTADDSGFHADVSFETGP